MYACLDGCMHALRDGYGNDGYLDEWIAKSTTKGWMDDWLRWVNSWMDG